MFDKIKDIFFKKLKNLNGGDRKKLTEILLVTSIIGLILIISGGQFLGEDNRNNNVKNPYLSKDIKESNEKEVSGSNNEIEAKMKSVISKIEGAGEVEVLISYSCSKEKVFAFETNENENISTEKNSEGLYTKNNTQNDIERKIAYEENDQGKKRPLIVKEIEPEIKGVIIVSKGASNVLVKERIMKAVCVALNLPIHKIEVIEKE